jgi:hypothetical protein
VDVDDDGDVDDEGNGVCKADDDAAAIVEDGGDVDVLSC